MSFTAYNGSVARTVNADTTVLQTVANFFPKGDTRYARTGATGTVTSVGLTMPVAFSVANSPVTTSGTLAVSAAGNATQYIRGDGELATLPSGGGGGSSVNYYMNGSVAASVATYKQMANTAVIGAGTNFPLVGNGLIAQFLTDSGNPNKLLIPSGAWNFEMFFSVSSSGGSQKFYVELLKYNGSTFTSIASSSAVPEAITGGTTIDLYLTSLAVPETVLLTTDRLAVRVYIVDSSGGRTTTLHTENSHLSLAITTFSGGISALNGLTDNTQYFAVGSTGTDFNISSVSPTHTFNIPSASASNRGLITTGTQTIAGAKTFSGDVTANSLINIPTTTSSVGSIYQNSTRFINTYTGAGISAPYTNISIGQGAGNFTQTNTGMAGYGNINIGTNSGSAITTGNNNTLIGQLGGHGITTGSSNVIVGYTDGGTITTGSGNTILGNNGASLSSSASNNVIISSGSDTRASFDGTSWTFNAGTTVTGDLSTNKTLAATQLTAGVGGTDSIVVHNLTTKKLSALSPSYYLTPTGSGSGLSGVVLTTTNQTGIAGNKSWTGTQTISNNVDISYGTTGVGALAVESTNSGGRALTVLGNSTIEPFVVSQQGAGLLAAFNKISGGSSTDQALIRNNGSIYTRGQLEVGNLLVGDATDSVMVHRAIDLTVRRVGTTGTGSAVFSASPTFTGTVAMAALTGTSATFSGQITSTRGNSGATVLGASSATTGGQKIDLINTSGRIMMGIEDSAGGSEVNGAPAYSSYLSSVNAQPLVFATSNTVRLTIASTGAATFSSSVTATGLVINNNGEALRAYGTSPNVSFYNAANTTRGGYVNHDGSNMSIVANVGSIVLGTAVSATGGATINDVFKIYSLSTSAGVVLQGYTGGLRIAVNGSGETGGTRGDLLAAAGDFSGALTGTSATFSGKIAFSANSGATASGQIGRDATYGMFQWASTGSTDDWTVFGAGGAYIMHVPTGTVNLAVGTLSGTGSRAVLADANGVLSAPVSDISVKQNIKPIGYGLNEIVKMNPVWFDFVDDYKNFGEGRQNGNIAQEMAKIIPEAVFVTPSTGKMGINYDQLHAIYIKAIQELKAEIDILKNK
jgi:hypothetical protein